jgi:hypothetical protein
MLNPSNKIISMKLNDDDVIEDVSSTSLLTNGLTPKTGPNHLSWSIITQPIKGITSIAIINSPNLIGPITYQLYDAFDTPTERTGGFVGDIVYPNAAFTQIINITANGGTTDGGVPKNLKLYLQGCFTEEQLVTKAQIEHRQSSSSK